MPNNELPNAWAYKLPTTLIDLLRQLSANVGQMPMPGGMSGDVRMPAFGSSQQAETNVDPAHYGETGGETTFFNQTMKGGMAPITALPTALGYPASWNPLGTNTPATVSDPSKWKPGQPVPAGYKINPRNPNRLIKI